LPRWAAARAAARCRAFVSRRRHMPVGRVGDEPGAAVIREMILEPMERASELSAIPIGLIPLIAAVVAQLVELGFADVLAPASLELRRPLKRNQALVIVRVDARNIRIPPRRPCRRQRVHRLFRRRRLSDDGAGSSSVTNRARGVNATVLSVRQARRCPTSRRTASSRP
jgi:hypothetical protein